MDKRILSRARADGDRHRRHAAALPSRARRPSPAPDSTRPPTTARAANRTADDRRRRRRWRHQSRTTAGRRSQYVAPTMHQNTTAVETTTVRTARIATRTRFSVAWAAFQFRSCSTAIHSRRSRGSGRRAGARLLSSAPLVRYRLALGADTIALDTHSARSPNSGTSNGAPPCPTRSVAGHAVRIAIRIRPDSFLRARHGSVAGAPTGSALLIDLPRTTRCRTKPDTLDDMRHLAVELPRQRGDVKSVGFSKLDTAEVRAEPGRSTGSRRANKYFLVALPRCDPEQPFSALRMHRRATSGQGGRPGCRDVAQPLRRDGSATLRRLRRPAGLRTTARARRRPR